MKPDAEWALESRWLGRRVWVFDRLASTNTLALELAREPGHEGLVLLARTQTAGRGQHGRTWLAQPNSSVLMSVLLDPPERLRRPALLTAWAAVSVCQVVSATIHERPSIKWPNDVLVGGKKVCGILIEQRGSGRADAPLATAVGIGLNVTQSAQTFKEANLPDAASLASLSGQKLSMEATAQQLIQTLDEKYHRLLDGHIADLEAIWTKQLGLLGRQVTVEMHGQVLHGCLKEIAFDGLVLETADEVLHLAPETVQHVVGA